MADETRGQTKKTLLSGVFLLTFSTVLVKIVGLLYKIPMLSLLGAEGMGYFNSAYEIYALFCVISTAGLPVALSVLISAALAKGETDRVPKIEKTAFRIFLLIGIAGSVGMFVFAPAFCDLIRNRSALDCIRAISPTVFLICVSSAIRGYFQGYQKMLPTALSQLLEALGKLFFGLLFAGYAKRLLMDPPAVAACAGVGLTLGTLLSTVYLILCRWRFAMKLSPKRTVADSETEAGARLIRRELAGLSVPITLGASLVSLTKLIDMTMILRRLQSIGYTEAGANAVYGSYTTLALSVFALLPTLANAVALPTVPLLSSAVAEGNREKQTELINSVYRMTALTAIPAGLGITVFARPILGLLFSGDAEAVSVAAPLLSCLGVSVFLSCMITATNSVLHAYQSTFRPILSMLAGAVVKIVCAYGLIGNPRIGIVGAPVSTMLCNLCVVLFNVRFVSSFCGQNDLPRIVWRPFFASFGAVCASFAGYRILCARGMTGGLLTVGAILATAGFYLLFGILFGEFRRADLALIPFLRRPDGVRDRTKTEKSSVFRQKTKKNIKKF